MENVLIFFALQGLLGAFDTLYHHEFTERLPWRATAGKELQIHGVRNLLYGVIFFSLGWVAWHGLLTWIFAGILVVEIGLTLWDFVVEDRTRRLPATERITHTILAINYGIILGFLMPVLARWAEPPTGFTTMNHGWLSWVMSFYALGVTLWALRDSLRARKLLRTVSRPTSFPVLPPQRVLVTGGTGFIGTALCQTLIDQGHRVTILTRDAASAAAKLHGRVTFIPALTAIATDEVFDTVINLAGEPLASGRWSEAKKRRIHESRVHTTEALLTLIARLEHKPALLISGSAIGYYGNDAVRDLTEESSPNPGFTNEVCAVWEAAARKAEAFGVRVCLLRTGIVLEKNGGALAQMLFPFEFGLGGPMGSGGQWMSWIHRDDLIGLMLHIIHDGTIRGPINATAPNPVMHRDFVRALGRAMKRPAFLPLPGFVLRLLLGEMGQALLLEGQKVLPTKAQAHGYVFRFAHISEALAAILHKNSNR